MTAADSPPAPARRGLSLATLTDRVATRRGATVTVIVWLLVAVASGVAAGRLPAPATAANALPASAVSRRAATVAEQAFPGRHGSPALIVFARSGGLSAADRAQARAFSVWLRSSAAPRSIGAVLDPFSAGPAAAGLVSRDRSTLIVQATINAADPTAAVTALHTHLGSGVGGLTIRITGPAGITADAVAVFSQGDAPLLLTTVGLVLLLLGIVYRAPLLALTPVIAVGWAYAIASALLTIGQHASGLALDGEATGLVTVLLFGAGTDYTLFIVSRYRRELRRQADAAAALRTALHGVGGAVLASGSVVLLATLTLLLASFGVYHDFGVALSISIAVVLLAGLTLIPALLTLLGRAAFWPAVPRPGSVEKEGSGVWRRIGAFVARRPGVSTALPIVVLAMLATGATRYQERFDFLQSYLRPTPSGDGFALLRQAFGAGTLAPAQVVLTASSGTLPPSSTAAVARALATVSGVASVAPAGVSRDGHTALLQLTFSGDPYALSTIDLIPTVRTQAQAALDAHGGGEALVGGETALSYDSKTLSDRDTRLIVPVVLLVIALVLGLLLRSALAPLYLLAINALGYAAAFGLLVVLNRTVLGGSNESYQFPLDLFVFLTALGADYNIFLLSRVREEAVRHPLPEAVRRGVAGTGGVITSAGIILAATFSVLAVEPLRETLEIGLGVALGVLLDTLLVRALLVPGVTVLLGSLAWWPTRPRTTEASTEQAPVSGHPAPGRSPA